ncbi:YybH family protein [Paracraurococcus lichenis]|uniref:Nuclear transport factor 2 family protein n=1 Tax=Paracraurococcus lichenis TaxID=3064888 RepID=A0ABT9EAW2_9PROT|nr:nuclear transport factor 2 family protein [Paracraurococcus sp. LOR1-02]MDO9713350.1 nuclear transport factor 2 family protein [Paracraurococcus sp. LOR1-02]
MRRTFVVGTAALLLLSTTPGAAAQNTDAEGVRAAASAFYAALNARDIGAMEALWARDANPVMIHPSGPFARSPAVGWEAVQRSFAEAWPRFAEWSVRVDEMRVRVGQGWAVVLATTPVHVKMQGSDAASDYTALATIVYERRDGRWLIIHQHVSRPPR